MVFGLSGGVDSFTMAALLRRAYKQENLLAIYVDTGLMPDETAQQVLDFCKKQKSGITRF
jgi:GMP synthase PP-ATPase subunit